MFFFICNFVSTDFMCVPGVYISALYAMLIPRHFASFSNWVKSNNKLNIAICKSQTQWRRRAPFKSSFARAPDSHFRCYISHKYKIDNAINHSEPNTQTDTQARHLNHVEIKVPFKFAQACISTLATYQIVRWARLRTHAHHFACTSAAAAAAMANKQQSNNII